MTNNVNTVRELLVGGEGDNLLKLEYFDFEGKGEKVRLALFLADIPFEDVRITPVEWLKKKAYAKYAKVPVLTLPNGTVVTQSNLMLHLAGEADTKGTLYPDDFEQRCKIDEILGLIDVSGRHA